MKNKLQVICIIGAFLGIWLSKFFGNKYGNNGRLSVAVAALAISLIVIIILFFKKYYLGASILLGILLPIGLSTLGIYLDNSNLILIGILLFFAIGFLILKLAPRLKK